MGEQSSKTGGLPPEQMEQLRAMLAAAGKEVAQSAVASLDGLSRDLNSDAGDASKTSPDAAAETSAQRRTTRPRSPRSISPAATDTLGAPVPVTPAVSGGETPQGESDGDRRVRQLPEIPDFMAYNPEALLRDYLAGTDQAKTKHIQSGLSFLRRMREEIYQLGGLRQLKERIDSLAGKALIERGERERIETICNAFWKEKKSLPEEITSGQLVGPLQEMLLTTQGLLKELRERAATEGVPERPQRIPFPEKLVRIRELAAEWDALHQRVPPARYTAFNVAIRDALQLEKGLIVVPEFLDWLDKQGKEHGWEGDASKPDKRSAGIRLSILEKMVAMAKEKLPEFEQPLPRGGAAGESKGTTSSADAPVTESSGEAASTPVVDPVISAVPPVPETTPNPTVREKRFKSAESYKIARHIEELNRKDEEIRYRDANDNLYVVRPTRNNDFFELWYPDKVQKGMHVLALVDELAAIGVAFESRGKQADGIDDLDYDPSLRGLEPEAVKSRMESASGILRREMKLARERLESDLRAKLKLFAERMDTHLRQTEPTLSFAKRRGRILAQLPEFAERVIQQAVHQRAALSPDERESIIEAHTQSVTIQR